MKIIKDHCTWQPTELDKFDIMADDKYQKSQIDKQIFDTKQFQNAANGTGLDLISRLPSVTVNVEGEILI
jgi:hypothetical protein